MPNHDKLINTFENKSIRESKYYRNGTRQIIIDNRIPNDQSLLLLCTNLWKVIRIMARITFDYQFLETTDC